MSGTRLFWKLTWSLWKGSVVSRRAWNMVLAKGASYAAIIITDITLSQMQVIVPPPCSPPMHPDCWFPLDARLDITVPRGFSPKLNRVERDPLAPLTPMGTMTADVTDLCASLRASIQASIYLEKTIQDCLSWKDNSRLFNSLHDNPWPFPCIRQATQHQEEISAPLGDDTNEKSHYETVDDKYESGDLDLDLEYESGDLQERCQELEEANAELQERLVSLNMILDLSSFCLLLVQGRVTVAGYRTPNLLYSNIAGHAWSRVLGSLRQDGSSTRPEWDWSWREQKWSDRAHGTGNNINLNFKSSDRYRVEG